MKMEQHPRHRFTPRRLITVVMAVTFLSLTSCITPARVVEPVLGPPASILGWSPGVSRDVPPSAPLTVYFTRAVNHTSVERSWRLTPRVSGAFRWSDTSVAFTPTQAMKSGAYYHLTVGHSARDDRGRPLTNPLDVSFSTGDPLKVLSVSPAGGTQQVPLNALVAVTFNHPMVPLAGLTAATPDPAGWKVSLSPATAGHGSWLGTSTWVFHPDTGLVPSSSYSITVSGAARDAWGEPLGSDLQWTFQTITPQVVGTAPAQNALYANPNGSMRITFNQPMDHPSTERAFSLAAGRTVPGTLSWQGDSLIFTPSAPLDPSAQYSVAIAPSARAAHGVATLGKPFNLRFRVAQPPRVVSTIPSQGATANAYDVELHFSAPMNQRSLDQRLTVSPPLAGMVTSIYGTTYSVSGAFRPSTAYTVTIGAGAQDRLGRTLTAPYTLRFTTAPLAPSVAFSGMPGIYSGISVSAGRSVDAPVHFVNMPQVRYTLMRVSPSDAVRTPGGCSNQAPAGTTLQDWTAQVAHPLDQPQHSTVHLARVDGTPLSPGIYWLGAQGLTSDRRSGLLAASEVVVVSNASITLKTDATQTLVWVTSATTGRPLPGAAVQLFDSTGKLLASGRTDARGIHTFPRSFDSLQAAAVDDGRTVAMTLNDWRAQTFADTRFSPADRYVPPPTGAYAYTDRPIYRPGQRVHFRAIIWRDSDGLYSLYGPRAVQIQISDSTGKTAYATRLTLDRFGSIHGAFRLAPAAPTGPYQIQFTLPQNSEQSVYASATFSVAEYRKPEFLTNVSADRTDYVQGQTVNATVQVRYLFGAPVTGQAVSWTAYTQDSFTPPPGWESYAFGDQDAIEQQDRIEMSSPGAVGGMFGKEIAHGDGTTDGSGQLRIQVPVDLSRTVADQTITVEATLTDINHRSISGRVQVAAHRAAFSVGLLAGQQVVRGGDRATVDVVAVKDNGSPLAGHPLTARIYQRTYTSVPDTQFNTGFWRQVPHDRLVASRTVATDGQGRSQVTFTPQQGGIYNVVVEGSDNAGRQARSSLLIYSSAGGWSDFGQSSASVISLQPDRAAYRVGETAHVLVAAPFAQATALVTVERGTIRSVHVRRLASNSSTVDVPITLADLPNVYVSVTVYRGWRAGAPPDWRTGVTNLPVRVNPRRLHIHLSQDRSRYHPGDTVTYSVKTTDVHGRPVSAEVSLALVDTAVLALQNETNPSILQALYGQRPLGVGTASDGIASINRLQQTGSGGPVCGLGGGGGGPGGRAPAASGIPRTASSGVRHRFADTAYWSAGIVTDGRGMATVRLQLPDNLTTWRLDARGITADQRVGQQHAETLSTQDVILRPVTPRFLLQGDDLEVGTVVNNTLGRPLDLKVSLAATGLRIESGARAGVTVPAHGERLVLWKVAVPSADSATLVFRAVPSAPGVQGDAVSLALPVHPPLTAETVATAGQVYGSVKQLVVLPAAARSSLGGLEVQLSPALTRGMGAAYAVFRPTPYDSNEDIAERLLAAASLRSLPRRLTGLSPQEYAGLTHAIGDGAAQLAANQLSDGGWPWYNGDNAVSDRTISTDVVEALSDAGARGRPAAQSLQRGLRYLHTALPGAFRAQRIHILSVLARAHVPDQTSISSVFNNTVQRAQLDPASLADLARALDLAGRPQAAASLIALLDSRAMISATGAHWEGGVDTGRSAVTTTTSVLAALIQLAPRDALVPAAARWLMLARQGDTWDCPPDTAHALAVLAGYARAAGEGKANYRYRVTIGGRQVLAGQYARGAAARAASAQVPVSALRHNTASALQIQRQPVHGTMGTGPLYYVARLQYFLPAASIQPRSEGVSVGRRYLKLSGQQIDEMSAGSVVKVELTIRTNQTLEYLQVDDPVPAGLEPIDQSLKTSRQGLFPGQQPATNGTEIALAPYLTHTDLRDDRVSLYVTSLPPGTYTYAYLAEAATPGQYGVAPARAAETFFPEVFGRSAGQTFTVK